MGDLLAVKDVLDLLMSFYYFVLLREKMKHAAARMERWLVWVATASLSSGLSVEFEHPLSFSNKDPSYHHSIILYKKAPNIISGTERGQN